MKSISNLFKVVTTGNVTDESFMEVFCDSYFTNPKQTIKLLLWLRDPREGLGKRKLFRLAYNWLVESNEWDMAVVVTHMVPLIGRWDDIMYLSCQRFERDVVIPFIVESLVNKSNNYQLLIKWLPKENSKNHDFAVRFVNAIFPKLKHGTKMKYYRKFKSSSSPSVERLMSTNQWEAIKYKHVPKLARVRNHNAYLRHSYTTYIEFINSHHTTINPEITWDLQSVLNYPKYNIF